MYLRPDSLPKHGVDAPSPFLKRLWSRYSQESTKRAPFLLLVLLLSCQLLFLALLRSDPASPSGASRPSFLAYLLMSRTDAQNHDPPPPLEFTSPPPTLSSSSSQKKPSTEERLNVVLDGGSSPATAERSVGPNQSTDVEDLSSLEEEPEKNAILVGNKSSISNTRSCENGYVYVYDLPPMFNSEIASKCASMNPWQNLCSSFLNNGLGVTMGDASPLGQIGSWYYTDQFMLEVIFHHRILQYPCITTHPHEASAFYIPYYAGLDIGQYLWSGFTAQQRDGLSDKLLEWLSLHDSWGRHGGSDHFMMVGRITWDFRRSKEEDWGSEFFYKPAMKNVTRLVIERNPWDEKEMAVPYPTHFHPRSGSVLTAWQNYIRKFERTHLFSFAGAPRQSFPNDFRGILVEQCQQAENCLSLDCSNKSCHNNQKTMELFMTSTFCLQPRGDSFTRRSTFDCILAGSIPVFFWHRSAYWQYKWHLPDEESSYSVFISKQDIRNGTKIEEILKAIAPDKVLMMRERVIQLIPKIVYALSGSSLKEHSDAFAVAIEGVMKKLKSIPADRV